MATPATQLEPRVEAEVVNTTTGEVSTALVKMERELPAAHAGASTLAFTKEEAAALRRELPAELHDILPTGEPYVPQVQYRRILADVLGIGQWALIPVGDYIRQGKTLCREYALYVRGHWVTEHMGEADYHESNDRMSWATAAEAAQSNALTRCCKDLLIASECWDKRWVEAWKATYAVQVWVKDGGKPQWRRKDAAPFWNETGIVTPKPGAAPAPASKPAAAPAPAAAPVEPKPGPTMYETGAKDREGNKIMSPFPGPYLDEARMRLLFGVAKDNGVKAKDEVYPYASKALGVTITSIKQIPISRLDDVVRAFTGQPSEEEQ